MRYFCFIFHLCDHEAKVILVKKKVWGLISSSSNIKTVLVLQFHLDQCWHPIWNVVSILTMLSKWPFSHMVTHLVSQNSLQTLKLYCSIFCRQDLVTILLTSILYLEQICTDWFAELIYNYIFRSTFSSKSVIIILNYLTLFGYI